MAQAFDSFVRRKRAFAHLVEQLSDGGCVHNLRSQRRELAWAAAI
jgi:hypothetical protein